MRLVWLALGTSLAASGASSDGPYDARARAEYWSMLDSWVNDGGPLSEVQSRVADNCTKLVLATVDYSEWAALLTTRPDELKFRADVCVKATVHRVHPQPEFSNPIFVGMICRDAKVALYRELCVKADLRPDANAT
jgi:hypothetical protein